MDDRNRNKICKLKNLERKLHNISVSVEGNAVKMLAGLKIPSGYENNDEKLLGLILGTPCMLPQNL